jgi:hypothetical protein
MCIYSEYILGPCPPPWILLGKQAYGMRVTRSVDSDAMSLGVTLVPSASEICQLNFGYLGTATKSNHEKSKRLSFKFKIRKVGTQTHHEYIHSIHMV